MQYYCLGFAFDRNFNVVVIEKKRPQWMKGKLNGIGGKIDIFKEDCREAMAREFREETGMLTQDNEWISFETLCGNGYNVMCYYGVFDTFDDIKTTTDEEIYMLGLDCLRAEYGNNILEVEVPWLIEKAVSIILKGK